MTPEQAAELKRLAEEYVDDAIYMENPERDSGVAICNYEASQKAFWAYIDSLTQDAQQPVAWMTEAQIDEYIDDYEMIGEDVDGRDACHVPTADEKALIKDAIMGLTALPQPVQAEIADLTRQLEDARKDAERYRWLTCNAYVGIAPYPTPHEVWCMRLPNPANCHNLDAAIDAAMTNEG